MSDKEQRAKNENVLNVAAYILFAVEMIFLLCIRYASNHSWSYGFTYALYILIWHFLSIMCSVSSWLLGDRSLPLIILLVLQALPTILFVYVISKVLTPR